MAQTRYSCVFAAEEMVIFAIIPYNTIHTWPVTHSRFVRERGGIEAEPLRRILKVLCGQVARSVVENIKTRRVESLPAVWRNFRLAGMAGLKEFTWTWFSGAQLGCLIAAAVSQLWSAGRTIICTTRTSGWARRKVNYWPHGKWSVESIKVF